jgi:hypothetical protein
MPQQDEEEKHPAAKTFLIKPQATKKEPIIITRPNPRQELAGSTLNWSCTFVETTFVFILSKKTACEWLGNDGTRPVH